MQKKSEQLLRNASSLGSLAIASLDYYKKYFDWVLPPLFEQILLLLSVLLPLIILASLYFWILYLWPYSVRIFQKIFYRRDVWVYDAAHYMVSRDWKAAQIVGYGVDVGRLQIEGTTLFGTSVNVQTGEKVIVKHTPEEGALAIRNTKVENLNNALELLRQTAADGLPVWTKFDDNGEHKLIDAEYWNNYGFDKIIDLKQASAESLKTCNLSHPNERPIYHSLRTNKREIEKRCPPETPSRSLYGSSDFSH